MKQKILDARKIIVTTKDWVADGYTAYIEDENGNLLKKIPAFSEVFPGWELPTDPSPTPTHFWQANASTYSPSISAIDPNAWLFYRAINNVKLLPANDDSIIPFWYVDVSLFNIHENWAYVSYGRCWRTSYQRKSEYIFYPFWLCQF